MVLKGGLPEMEQVGEETRRVTEQGGWGVCSSFGSLDEAMVLELGMFGEEEVGLGVFV